LAYSSVMNNPARIHLAWLFEHGSRTSAGIAVAVGVLVLLGWVFNVAVLKSVVPGFTPMKANAAVGFILAGVSLWSAASGTQSLLYRRISQVCAGAVLLLGVLTLGEYLSGQNFGIDQLLVRDVMNYPGDIPGRMVVNTAICFTVLGASLALLIQIKSKFAWVIQALAIVPILVAGVMLFGYAYERQGFLQVRLAYTPMALHTAAVFLLLGLGILSARPDYPFRRVMTSNGAVGGTTRLLLPVVIGFPLIIAWLIVDGYTAGYFKGAVGVALFAVTSIVGLSALILWNAGLLEAIETRRRQAEAQLHTASRYARNLLEVSLDALVTISAEGKVTDVNEAAIKVTGIPREQLVGTDFSDYFTEPEQAREGYRQVFNQGFVTDYPLTIRHQDGHLTDVLYNSSVYRDAQGNVLGVFAAARDITGRKRAEAEIHRLNAELEQRVINRTAQLEAAVKELESFSYSVSHDLRTPLRAIDGFSRILLEDHRDQLDDEGKRLLNVVRDNTSKMSHLIDDILHFARMGRLELALTDIDMEALAREVLEDLRPTLEGRNVKVDIGVLPPVRGDRNMYRQVFVNLIANAIKFTRPREVATIEIAATAGESEHVYFVRDNGVGFDMQYVDKLFGVFQRLHGPEVFEGTGIGLAIVRRVITRHGGRAWAEGRLNEGATFYFALPAKEANHG
jgi:PAS domain S-box-containing protein